MTTDRKRLWVVLRQAVKSDNHTVKSALERLLVTTEVAHGEEIAKILSTDTNSVEFLRAIQALRDAQLIGTKK